MLIENEIKIEVKSSKIISKVRKIGLSCKIGDVININIIDLWPGSNIKVKAKCDVCGYEKLIQYNLYNKNVGKYGIYSCSNKCAYFKNKITNLERYGFENYVNPKKSKQTKKERYGDENYNNLEKSKQTKKERYGDENYNNIEKIKKTNLERYGVEYTLLSEIVIDKIKKTNLVRYKNSDYRKSDYVKEKRKKTFLEKYGVESYMETEDFRIKSKYTYIEKYGVDSPNKSDIIKEKKLKTMIMKYGYVSNSCTEDSKRKLRETNMKRYGVEYPMQLLEFCEKQQRSSRKIVYYNENIYYQSSYEKDFLDYFNNIGLLSKIKRGPVVKYTYDGVEKIYYPDFYFEELNLIIEIKSSYYFNKYYNSNIEKMKKCIEIGYNFIFIINKNYKFLNSIISPQFNG